MNTKTLTLLLPSAGRSISDDHWQEIDSRNIECWREACSVLRTQAAHYRGASLKLEFEWEPVLAAQEGHFATMEALDAAAGTSAVHGVVERFSRSPIEVPITLRTDVQWEPWGRPRIAESLAESGLYDAFLMMNLAAPGSFNLYTASLRSENEALPSTPIEASEYYFDAARIEGIDGHWPNPAVLPLAQVADWFFKVRQSHAQVPTNPAEKALFALLHLSRMDLAPTAVVWLFYALETLLDTRPGENIRVLADRLNLLLRPDAHQAKRLKKELRELYNIRSSLVHGGLEVVHPMHDESLDPRVEEEYWRVTTSAEYGFRVLLSVVQSLIARGVTWPRFEEVLRDG